METYDFPNETSAITMDFPTLVTTFEDNTEQRRQVTNKPIIGFKVRSSALTEEQAQDRHDFYLARGGKFEAFLFTYRGQEYTVRFDSEYQESFAGGYYTVSFDFKVVNEDEI